MPSGSVISRSSVPEVRSRSIVIDVTRNIVTNGKSPSSGAPTCWKTGERSGEQLLQERLEQARHADDQDDRARVAPQLREHAQRDGER